MKNPMDRQFEKRLSERAVAIGRQGEVAAFGELLELLRSSSANARRLSASALGKLAWLDVDQAYGAAAQGCLSDLRDMARNASEKDYIQRDAASAVAFIEEALRIAASSAVHRCQRCHARVTADEFARSESAFQRVFCDRCCDEVFLERRIAEWLTAHGLAYRYDAKFRIIAEFQIRPDFYLPEPDVYIEYWGLDTPQYKTSAAKSVPLAPFFV